MGDGLIHIPARKKLPVEGQQIVRITAEAYNVLVDIYNESTMSMAQIVSAIVMQSKDRIVYDKGED